MTWSRRNLFRWAGRSGLALPLLTRAQQRTRKDGVPADTLPGAALNRKLKVVFVGAHIDDWIDCAGTIARYAKAGHKALLLSFTPGDSWSMADINHMPLDGLGRIRPAEEIAITPNFG